MEFSREVRETAEKLRLIDDTMFRLVASRKGVCQEIIRTLLHDDKLVVISVTPQESITSLHREVWLDALCRMADGSFVNVEVQKGNQNDDVRRCRFHISAITANKTEKGMEFADIPNVTVIYITEYDVLRNDQTVTRCEMCQEVNGEYIPVNDGAKVYYANTVIKDGSEESELLSLFLERKSFDSAKYPEISEAMSYYKDDKEGVNEVCKIVKDFAERYAEEKEEAAAKAATETATDMTRKDIAKSLLEDGMSAEKVAEKTKLSLEDVKKLVSE